MEASCEFYCWFLCDVVKKWQSEALFAHMYYDIVQRLYQNILGEAVVGNTYLFYQTPTSILHKKKKQTKTAVTILSAFMYNNKNNMLVCCCWNSNTYLPV